MTEAETKQRQDEARMMAIAQKQRSITLEILRQRFKCSGQEAFAVIQGQDLESETRNKIFAFLCPPPPPPAPSPPPEPEPAPAPVVPRVPVVANFLVPTRKEREAARAAEAARGPERSPQTERYMPPKPDPVPETRVVARQDAPAPPQPAASAPAPSPSPSPVADAPRRNKGGTELARPDVGERIQAAMRAEGYTAATLAPFFGHSSGSNISAALGKSGTRALQLRLCRLFALDDEGRSIPGKKPTLPLPRSAAAMAPENLVPMTKRGPYRKPAGHPAGLPEFLPKPPSATDKVPITLLNDEQAAAMFELSESAVELHRTTKENNAAGLRYRRALARAEAVGVRFVTTNQPPPTNPPPNPA
jgi:hypothetical protein